MKINKAEWDHAILLVKAMQDEDKRLRPVKVVKRWPRRSTISRMHAKTARIIGHAITILQTHHADEETNSFAMLHLAKKK